MHTCVITFTSRRFGVKYGGAGGGADPAYEPAKANTLGGGGSSMGTVMLRMMMMMMMMMWRRRRMGH